MADSSIDRAAALKPIPPGLVNLGTRRTGTVVNTPLFVSNIAAQTGGPPLVAEYPESALLTQLREAEGEVFE
jgi:hypothetical protein